MTEIVPGVYQVDGVNGHAFIIVDNGITVIDTGMGGDKKILEMVNKLGYTPADIKQIIITHCHVDHIGGLRALKDASGATVMAGDADADVIEGKKPTAYPKMPFPISIIMLILRNFIKARPTPVDRRLKDGDVIPVLGGLKVVGLPGHSSGSIGLYCPSQKLFFSGDALRMKGDDFIKPLNYDAYKAQCLASIKKMGALDYEIMLSGHSDPIMADASKKVAAYAEKLSTEG